MKKETRTIVYSQLQEADLLWYRPKSFFGRLIGFYTQVHEFCINWKKDGLEAAIDKFHILAFSHSASMQYDEDGNLRRYDAMEGKDKNGEPMKTGFREEVGQAYVFRLKDMTQKQKNRFAHHLHSRQGSEYDRPAILSFLFPHLIDEDEFKDYCSELTKNGLIETRMNLGLLQYGKISPYVLYRVLRPNMEFIGLII